MKGVCLLNACSDSGLTGTTCFLDLVLDTHTHDMYNDRRITQVGVRDVNKSKVTLLRRVLQWNLLAEGLVPEGFMMPLVSQKHVERSASWSDGL